MSNKFQISLRENGEHSFKRSLEAYEEYEKTKDQMLLKDTIMFLHQSIELLMKQMLVDHSPYLIFEDLKDLPRKQKEANAKKVSIFFIDKPPRSVTYDVALERVEAFLNPPELDDTIKENLDRLNRLRNQLEHYAINADRDEVVSVLNAVQKPILAIFEKYLGPLTQLHTRKVSESIGHITERSIQLEVLELMRRFNNQRIPGRLLGIDGEIILPKFDRIEHEYPGIIRGGEVGRKVYRIDIFAETLTLRDEGKVRWLVEVKRGLLSSDFLDQLKAFGDRIENSKVWLVAITQIPSIILAKAKRRDIMITGYEEYNELKKLLLPE